MPNTRKPRTKVVHYVCAALMLALLILQFSPFWTYGEGGEATASISRYIWFPTAVPDLTAHLQQVTGNPDFLVNNVLLPCILMLLLSAGGILLCILKPDSLFSSLVTAACGLSGVLGFLFTPALRLGSTWILQLLLCLLLLAGGVYAVWGTTGGSAS